jgi:hypothetical protein
MLTLLVNRVTGLTDPATVSTEMRRRRAGRIEALIDRIYQEKGSCRILDIGGETGYWRLFDWDALRARRVQVVISNFGSWSKPVEVDRDLFVFEEGDGCDLPYPDNSFDLVHSNSVLEHVGDWSRMQMFARQVRRLAPHYYVQTPYFWFPYEPHFGTPFFHWLPESMRVSLLINRPMGFYPRAEGVSQAMEWAQSARLLDHKQFRSLFPDATVHSEKLVGLTKSLIAVRESTAIS